MATQKREPTLADLIRIMGEVTYAKILLNSAFAEYCENQNKETTLDRAIMHILRKKNKGLWENRIASRKSGGLRKFVFDAAYSKWFELEKEADRLTRLGVDAVEGLRRKKRVKHLVDLFDGMENPYNKHRLDKDAIGIYNELERMTNTLLGFTQSF